MKIETGKIYNVSHNRKGNFTMMVESLDDEWASGTIVEGKTKVMNNYNEKEKGEALTVRISLCTFNEVK